jgi:DNA-binding beta-propeller fold protein YncE
MAIAVGTGGLAPRLQQAWSAAGAVAVLLAACAAPQPSASPGVGSLIYVASAAEGTITRLDATTGRVRNPSLPAGVAPWRMVPGPDGSVLVLSVGTTHQSKVLYLFRAGNAWVSRPIDLHPRARGVQIAGDGGRYAVAVYRIQTDPAIAEWTPCRMALIDLESGRIDRTHHLCAADEIVQDVALENGTSGPIAYLAMWRRATQAPGATNTGSGRIQVVQAETGASLGFLPLAGVPGRIMLAPSSERLGLRLYCVQGIGMRDDSSEYDAGVPEFYSANRWQLLKVDPVKLEMEREYEISALPRWLTVAADGKDAYAIAGYGSPDLGSTIMHLDLTTGGVRLLGRAPGTGFSGLAVADRRIYVPDGSSDGVAVVNRRDGAFVKTIHVGRHPIGILSIG